MVEAARSGSGGTHVSSQPLKEASQFPYLHTAQAFPHDKAALNSNDVSLPPEAVSKSNQMKCRCFRGRGCVRSNPEFIALEGYGNGGDESSSFVIDVLVSYRPSGSLRHITGPPP
ncbi:unnamed protein product [Ectocarpus sp. 8 AP-2014]